MTTQTTTNNSGNSNFVSAYVERQVSNADSDYTWAKVKGWSGNPEYIRHFPYNPDKGYNAMTALTVAVENPQTLDTEWKDILVYDAPNGGPQYATNLAKSLIDLQPDGSNGPNPKVGFFFFEGYVKPYEFEDQQGNQRVKSKIVAKVMQCYTVKPYQPGTQQSAAQPNDPVFGSQSSPKPNTQPTQPQPQAASQNVAQQSTQPTVEQLQQQVQQLMQQLNAAQQQPQQAPPESFPENVAQFSDDVPF